MTPVAVLACASLTMRSMNSASIGHLLRARNVVERALARIVRRQLVPLETGAGRGHVVDLRSLRRHLGRAVDGDAACLKIASIVGDRLHADGQHELARMLVV